MSDPVDTGMNDMHLASKVAQTKRQLVDVVKFVPNPAMKRIMDFQRTAGQLSCHKNCNDYAKEA